MNRVENLYLVKKVFLIRNHKLEPRNKFVNSVTIITVNHTTKLDVKINPEKISYSMARLEVVTARL